MAVIWYIVNKTSLKRRGAFKEKLDFFGENGLRYCLPIMILYLNEKNQQNRWSRFREKLLTN